MSNPGLTEAAQVSHKQPRPPTDSPRQGNSVSLHSAPQCFLGSHIAYRLCNKLNSVSLRSAPLCFEKLSKIIASEQLNSVSLYGVPLYSVHGYARVHTSIYIYIYIYKYQDP